jgi:hypothetical protein
MLNDWKDCGNPVVEIDDGQVNVYCTNTHYLKKGEDYSTDFEIWSPRLFADDDPIVDGRLLDHEATEQNDPYICAVSGWCDPEQISGTDGDQASHYECVEDEGEDDYLWEDIVTDTSCDDDGSGIFDDGDDGSGSGG